MTKTEEFLMEAFAGESQANRKYSAFAAQADKEGFAQAARLFRAAAEAEAVHAANHLRALKAIKSTKENLREAIAGEKAGIINGGAVVVTAETDPAVLAVIEARCEEAGADLKLFGRDFRLDYHLPYQVPGEAPAQDSFRCVR